MDILILERNLESEPGLSLRFDRIVSDCFTLERQKGESEEKGEGFCWVLRLKEAVAGGRRLDNVAPGVS